MDKTANQILSLFENEEVDSLLNVLTETAHLFSKKFKSIGATVDTDGKAISIRNINVPSVLHLKVNYDIFFSDTNLQAEIKMINKIMRLLKKNVPLGNNELRLSREVIYDGQMVASDAQLHVYSSQTINSFLRGYMVSILNINTGTKNESKEMVTLRINPSLSFLLFDIIRMYKHDKVKEIEINEFTKLACDEVLTTADRTVKTLRLIGA